MNKNLDTFILAVILACIFKMATQCYAAGNGERYKDLFFPEGMPEKEGIYGNAPTLYKFHDEADVPDSDLKIILYSDKVLSGSDDYVSVHLSVVKVDGQSMEVVDQIDDIGKYVSVYLEAPGQYQSSNGRLDYFTIAPGLDALHMYVTGTLSGTGAITSGSDVFYIFDRERFSLVSALELYDTTSFGRSGPHITFHKSTSVYLVDMDEDGYTEIITGSTIEKYNRDKDNYTEERSSYSVYRYYPGIGRYSLDGEVAMLPDDAQELDKVHNKR